MYLGVTVPGPQPRAKLTIQHNHLNRKSIIQNQKYKCKSNIKFIYLIEGRVIAVSATTMYI